MDGQDPEPEITGRDSRRLLDHTSTSDTHIQAGSMNMSGEHDYRTRTRYTTCGG